jgi:predicted homoserine dehydrogenase-like protein
VDGHGQDEHAAGLSLEKILQHEFVGDSRDGGVAVCLVKIDGRPVVSKLESLSYDRISHVAILQPYHIISIASPLRRPSLDMASKKSQVLFLQQLLEKCRESAPFARTAVRTGSARR